MLRGPMHPWKTPLYSLPPKNTDGAGWALGLPPGLAVSVSHFCKRTFARRQWPSRWLLILNYALGQPSPADVSAQAAHAAKHGQQRQRFRDNIRNPT